MLRPYQQEAHDAIVQWIRKLTEPCMIEAATGAGKSHIIAALADTVHKMSGGKKILCLAPSAELVIQNSEKYKLTGSPFSIFSASAGQKHLRHPVVFGTPLTVLNTIEKFGSEFAMIVVDECHGITPTVKEIIATIARKNPKLRVVGMTATPYRMFGGYIFRQWPDGNPVPEDQTADPYFSACVFRITAKDLVDQGYLTKPVIGPINGEHYDTINMKLNSRGQFDAAEVDRAYVGQGRKTASIIADIVRQSSVRSGVMIFAATIQHAKECLESLPPELSAIVTGETPRKERADIIRRFKEKKIKYIVNVSVLTTGFDAPHVDVIAMLRATESVGLLQQIIGRGLRLSKGKDDCLILDYAQNVERHCPDGDIFNPNVRASSGSNGAVRLRCRCGGCEKENEFIARPNLEGYKIDPYGYFIDLDGVRIPSDFGDVPAHFGRRCQGWLPDGHGGLNQCNYRWSFKECKACGADNDIAARYCSGCKTELVDPNEKLLADFKEMKKDPTKRQTDLVVGWTEKPVVSKAGRPMIRIDVQTPYRTFPFWVPKAPGWAKGIQEKAKFDALGGIRLVQLRTRRTIMDGSRYMISTGKKMKFPPNLKIYGKVDFRGNCPSEAVEQVTFFNRIRRKYPDTWGLIAFHPRNEGQRHFRQVSKEKAEGMIKGASDVIIPADPTFVCEIKRRDHTKSKFQDGQEAFLNAAQKAGAFVCIALGADAAEEAFREYLEKHRTERSHI
jgi:DNA repair protein RadD